jgi:ubiquitin carboxyl-terminal hydrolase 40
MCPLAHAPTARAHQARKQQDAQELNRVLFEAIEQSLVGTAEADLISSLYEGCTAAAVQCTVCG